MSLTPTINKNKKAWGLLLKCLFTFKPSMSHKNIHVYAVLNNVEYKLIPTYKIQPHFKIIKYKSFTIICILHQIVISDEQEIWLITGNTNKHTTKTKYNFCLICIYPSLIHKIYKHTHEKHSNLPIVSILTVSQQVNTQFPSIYKHIMKWS